MTGPARPGRVRTALLILAAVVVLPAVTGCGVEVPDDVAARATATTTTEGVVTTTVPPTSADPLEQALIDNGYSVDEARCGAARLRQVLDDDEIEEIIEADSIEAIDPDVAAELTDVLRHCVDGTDEGGGDDGGPSGDGGSEDDPPGRRGGPRRPTGAPHP